MSTTQPVGKCTGTAVRGQYLPVDLLLEIVARSHVTTIVRCTATSRILRRAIVDPVFRRRVALQSLADAGRGFDPALLSGVSYRTFNTAYNFYRTPRVIHTPSSTQPRVRLDASNLGRLTEPVASRDGLLLLRLYRGRPGCFHVEIRVCHTFTGNVTSLPQIAMSNTSVHAFLDVGDAGDSYELVVVGFDMRFQTFSSKHGQWGSVRQVSVTGHDRSEYWLGANYRPAVIARTVYSRCCLAHIRVYSDKILAVDIDAAAGTLIDIPAGCFSRMMASERKEDKRILLASLCGQLSLIVLESEGISMWTMTPASSPQTSATWSRQLVIGKVEIEKAAGLVDYTVIPLVLEGFGERSGAVIVRVGKGDLLRLDLGTKVVKRLHDEGDVFVTGLFLHETDLVSLLRAMKYF